MKRKKGTTRTSDIAAPPPGRGRISLVVIAIAALCYLYPQHSWTTYRNVNEQARLYFVKAIVEDGVLNIDAQIKKYGDLQDKATRDGHFFCDKPVGLSVIAVPVYAILEAGGRVLGTEWTMQRMRYALTIFCVTLPALFLLVLLDRYWTGLGAAPWLTGLGLLAYGLGSIAFTYSTQFIGHQLAAVLAFAHFFLSRGFGGRVPWWKLLLAGALAGFGAITDFFSALIHVVIVLSYLPRIRPFSAWAPFLAGGAVAFSPLPIYNFLAFGGVTKMSYGQEALPLFKKLHGTGFFGVTFPRPESISGLLISPAKGLFWISPFLLLGLVGVAALVRDRERKRDGIVIAISIAVIAWLALSVVEWRAGWTVGPRHMVSMLPFLATGAVAAVLRYPRLCGALAVTTVLSIVLVFVPTMTLPAFDVDFVHPFTQQAMFLLGQGIVAPNPGQAIGLPGAWSLLIPALLLAGCVGYVLLQAFRGGARIDALSVALPALVIASGAWVVGSRYPPLPEPMTLYSQGRMLKLVDAPRLAASRFEQAVAYSSDPVMRREAADHAFPEAVAIYGELSDFDSVNRIAKEWARIDPSNRKLRVLLSRIDGSRTPAATP